MNQENKTSLSNSLSKVIGSLSLNKDELKKLCFILQERANTAADLEISHLKKLDNQTDEEFEKNKELIREAFELYITINGLNGEQLGGPIDVVFDSPHFPEIIKSLYVNSEAKLKTFYNYFPRNSFELFLDFDKPRILDLSFLPSNRTPNGSNFQVKGSDTTWVNGVYNEISNFIDQKSSGFSFVHKQSIYDLFLIFLGIPFSIWICYKSSNFIESSFYSYSVFIKNAIYIYIFLFSLFVFRILFHYLRWVCPLVEYRSPGNKVIAHRAILVTLLIGIFGTFLYDVLKLIF